MTFFQKKPIVVEAVQWRAPDGAEEPWPDSWTPVPFRLRHGVPHPSLIVPTRHGIALAAPGDYVVRDVKGDFYPCDREVFEATYDAVPNALMCCLPECDHPATWEMRTDGDPYDRVSAACDQHLGHLVERDRTTTVWPSGMDG